MTRLKPAQQGFITTLQTAKQLFDKRVAAIEARARIEKEQARAELAPLVQRALEAGVPARQVALTGLGYANVVSLDQFRNASVTERAASAPLAVVTSPYTFERIVDTQRGGFNFQATGPDGWSQVLTIGKGMGIHADGEMVWTSDFMDNTEALEAFKQQFPTGFYIDPH